MTGKIYRFSIAVPSGLEDVALDELRERALHIRGVNMESGGRLGQIFFTYQRSPKALAGMRSAVHWAGLIAEIHRVTVDRPGLEAICDKIARLDLAEVKRLARSQNAEVDVEAFALSATMQGNYRFDTSDLVRAVGNILREKHGLRDGQGQKVLRIHLQLTGHRALLGLRLGQSQQPGAAVAHCFIRLLGVEGGAHILWARSDIAELSALAEAAQPALLVAMAPTSPSRSLQLAAPQLVAAHETLPLKQGSFDYVFIILNGDLVAELGELARILRFGGVALVQIAQADRFFSVLDQGDYPFVVLANLPMRERGRHCAMVILERLEEYDPDLLQVSYDV